MFMFYMFEATEVNIKKNYARGEKNDRLWKR